MLLLEVKHNLDTKTYQGHYEKENHRTTEGEELEKGEGIKKYKYVVTK